MLYNIQEGGNGCDSNKYPAFVSDDTGLSSKVINKSRVYRGRVYCGKFCRVLFFITESPQIEKLTHGNLAIRKVATDNKLNCGVLIPQKQMIPQKLCFANLCT